MASITKQRVGKYTYFYESISYWDRLKKRPDNVKTCIGKLDLLTGEPVYKKAYLDKLVSEGKSIESMRLWDKPKESKAEVDDVAVSTSAAVLALDTVKDYGVGYFLTSIAEKIGLTDVLRGTFPDEWQHILCIACYLVASGKPLMYCRDWVESNEGFPGCDMSGQRISELLAEIKCASRTSFYRSWYQVISENECIALDTTSVSSYSNQINAVEWGYNRDGEALPQVNVCLLYGEISKLPVYQTLYAGSLCDVSTLKATLDSFLATTSCRDVLIITDKGFHSTKNIEMLLDMRVGESKLRFLTSIPFTSKFAINLIERERDNIDKIENVIQTTRTPIRGVHRLTAWREGVNIHTYVYFDPEKAIKEKNALFGYVAWLAQQATLDRNNKKLAAEFEKYLRLDYTISANSESSVIIREDVVARELRTAGWLVLVGSDTDNAQSAYNLYRMKDVAEKGFWKYKNNLGLDRLRVHNDERVENKLFIGFISLILQSAIYQTMKAQGLFTKMTFDKLILTLAKLKSASISGKSILGPVSKSQRTIFDAFGLSIPERASISILPHQRDKMDDARKRESRNSGSHRRIG